VVTPHSITRLDAEAVTHAAHYETAVCSDARDIVIRDREPRRDQGRWCSVKDETESPRHSVFPRDRDLIRC